MATEEKKDAVATRPTSAIAVPTSMSEFVTVDRPAVEDTGLLGTEGIGRDDVLIPRIGLAQKMSPEIEKSDPKYIDGLEFADLFHSTDRRKIGKGPLHFIIIKRYEPRWMQFKPIAEGGGLIDRDVPAGDSRTKFGKMGEKPEATMFLDYLVMLLSDLDMTDPIKNVAALSLKSSGIKAAKTLNMLVKMRGDDKLICRGVYQVTTGQNKDKKSGGVYSTYKFADAGWVKEGSVVESLVVEMYHAWKDRAVTIDTEDRLDEDPDAFEPAKYEPQAGARGAM